MPVEHVTKTYVTIRWALAGIYDLNLKDNVLTPRSSQTQTKGKARWYKKDKPLWKAADIVAVRKMVDDELRGEEKRILAAAMSRHAAAMPHSNLCECEDCLTKLAEA